MARPLIGITTYHRSGGARESFHLPTAYVDAVRRAGGVPVLLPPGEAHPEELLRAVDGIVFGGGGDLDPRLFGGEPHPANYALCPERDAFELALLEVALHRRVPVLAICRGLQLVNVLRGGSLHLHLPEPGPGGIRHRASQEEPCEHPVDLEAGSELEAILGGRRLTVASWHHQAVDRPGAGLEVRAEAPDGTVESLALRGQPQLLAVQWHPELQATPGAPQLRLFEALVRRAGGGSPAGR